MHAYVHICLQPIYRRAIDGPNWIMRLLFAVLVLLGPILLALGTKWQLVWLAGVLIPVGMLGFLWWVGFMNSVLLQLTPLMVLTTPTLQRRLRRVTLVMWGALSLAFGALLTVLYGHFLLNVVLTGLVLASLNLFQLQPGLAAGWWFVLMGFNFLPAQWQRMPLHLQLSVPIQVAGGALLVLLLGGYQMLYLFPVDARRVRRPLRLWPVWRSAPSMPAVWAAGGTRYRASALFNAALRRDCAQRDDGRLLLHALGPEFHWAYWLWPAVSAGLIMLVLSFFVPKQMSWLMLYLLAAGVGPNALRIAFGKTRKEQALVWLAPSTPRGAAFNRLLRLQLLRWYGERWLIATAAIVGVTACHGASWQELGDTVLRCTVFLLPAGAMLADFSRGAHNSVTVVLTQVALIVAVCVYQGLGWPWPVFGGLCVTAAALHLLLRWRLGRSVAPLFLPQRH